MKRESEFETREQYIEYLKLPKPFFTYEPDGCFEFHATAEDAQNRAKEILEFYSNAAADEGWHENITDVCWGKLKEQVVMTSRINRPPDSELDEDMQDSEGNYWGHEFSSLDSYELKSTEELNSQQTGNDKS